MKVVIVAALVLAGIAAAPSAAAQRDRGYGLGQIVGLSVDQAKQELSYAGYSKSRNIRIAGQQYDLWSNSRARDACVGFASLYGRVTDVRAFDTTECGVISGGPRGFDPDDLRGLRVDDAKRNLRNLGYEHERNIRADGRQWDLWRDGGRGRGQCIGFTSYNGRITDVRDFRDCGGRWDGGWGGRLSIDDLPGLSVDSAKRMLSSAGYDKARNINVRGRQWDLWYEDRGRDGRCVGFTSYNGRVSDAREFDPRDCY